MKAQAVYQKTARGQIEIGQKSAGLSLLERRVLILINGARTATQVMQMSLVDNIAEVLLNLQQAGLIEEARKPVAVEPSELFDEPPAPPPAARPEPATADREINPREFMSNTLLRFTNRMRVSRLLDQINAAPDNQALKPLVKPWHDAIAETPTGIYQIDELKSALLEMLLENEFET